MSTPTCVRKSRLILAGILFILSVCGLAACNKEALEPMPDTDSTQAVDSPAATPTPTPTPTPAIQAEPLPADATADFIPLVATFTTDVFSRDFLENSQKNSLVSPLSVHLALSMTANGADNETLSQMEAVLGQGLTIDQLNEYMSAFIHNLPSHEGSTLNIANSIWYRDGFAVYDEFLQTNRTYYGADIRSSAFDARGADEINAWVEEKTEGMIDKIIEEIPGLAIMYLINAIAFDAEWDTPYEENKLSERPFHAASGKEQDAWFMNSEEDNFLDDGRATGFIKPYKDGAYSFVALLPNEGVDIGDYIAGLDGEGLINTLNNSRQTPVMASLPKFSFTFDMTMNDMLTAMGMPDAFSPNSADFSRLGSVADGDNIYINRVLHKTFVDVDEKGTRAAAVTGVEMQVTSVRLMDYVILDRPFVFCIIESDSKLPIFIGALLEMPAWSKAP